MYCLYLFRYGNIEGDFGLLKVTKKLLTES